MPLPMGTPKKKTAPARRDPPRQDARPRETSQPDIKRLCATIEAQMQLLIRQQEAIETLMKRPPPPPPLPPMPKAPAPKGPVPRRPGPVDEPKEEKTDLLTPETKITVGTLSTVVREALKSARIGTRLDTRVHCADARALSHMWMKDPHMRLILPDFVPDYPAIYLCPTEMVGMNESIVWMVEESKEWVWWVEKAHGQLRRTVLPTQLIAKRVGPWVLTDPGTEAVPDFRENWKWHTETFAPTLWQGLKRGWPTFRRLLWPSRATALIKPALEQSIGTGLDGKREKMTEKSIRLALHSKYNADLEYRMLQEYFFASVRDTVDISVERVAWHRVVVLNERHVGTADTHHENVATARDLEMMVYSAEPPIHPPRYWKEICAAALCACLLLLQWRSRNASAMRWQAWQAAGRVLDQMRACGVHLKNLTLGQVVASPLNLLAAFVRFLLACGREAAARLANVTLWDLCLAPARGLSSLLSQLGQWLKAGVAPFWDHVDYGHRQLQLHTPQGDPRQRAKEMFPMIFSWRGFYTLVVVPFSEEMLKRTFAGHPFGSLVVFYLCAREGPVNLIKHALCMLWPFEMAVAFHSVNNLLALWMGHREPQIWSPVNVYSFLNVPVAPQAMMWYPFGEHRRIAADPLVAGSAGLVTRFLHWWHSKPPTETLVPDFSTLKEMCESLGEMHEHPAPLVPMTEEGIFLSEHRLWWPRGQAVCAVKPPGSFPVTFSKQPLFWPPGHDDYDPKVNPLHMIIKFGHFYYTAPARTEYNLWMVIRTRMLPDPPMERLIQMAAWEAMEPVPIVDHLEIPFPDEAAFEAFIEHMPSTKRAAYRRMRVEIENHPLLPHERLDEVEVMVKTDEILMRLIRVGDFTQFELKPRAISNVHMSVSAWIGPYVYEATARLKTAWDGYTPVKMGDWVFYPTFASSFTDAQLTDVFAFALQVATNKTAHILVAGDDSLIITADEGGYRFIEGDFSMFDSCQGEGPLLAEYEALEKLGVPQGVLTMLERSNAAPWVARFKHARTKMSIHRPPMRNTGGVDTTLGNSYVNMMLWTNALVQIGLYGDHPAYFASKGFEIKLTHSHEPTVPTFLKGKWWWATSPLDPTDEKFVWAPLPSRILKMGKAFTDPDRLYGRKGLHAALAFLYDAAVSQLPFLQVPLLRAFVEKWSSGIHARCGHAPELDEPYKVQASGVYGRWICSGIEDTCLRYEVEPADVLEAERLIREANPYSMVAHPLFVLMAGKDYNGWY